MPNMNPRPHTDFPDGRPYVEETRCWLFKGYGLEQEVPIPLRDRATLWVTGQSGADKDDLCEDCKKKFKKHMLIYGTGGATMVCPMSWIVMRKDASIEIITENNFQRRFRKPHAKAKRSSR